MSLLESVLLTGAFTLGAVVVTFAGTLLLERRRDRKTAREQRIQALAELLTATVDLFQGVQVIRAAYLGQDGWRRYIKRAGVVLAAIGGVLPGAPGIPALRSRKDWLELADWRLAGPIIDRLLAEDRLLDAGQRTTALDLATVLTPRTARFYAAVSALTLSGDEEIAREVRRLTPAVTGLLDVLAAKPRQYDRARVRADRTLGEFRDAVDRIRA